MNRDVKNRFFRISASIAAYQSACHEAYVGYSKAERKAKEDSAQFKDEAAEYARRERAAAEAARAAILNAREVMKANVQPELDVLEQEYHTQLMGNPAPGFFDRLRAYKDFGLEMTKAEAEQLLKQTYGSPMAVKALSKVIEDSGARFNISGGVDYASDLKTIRHIISTGALCTNYDDGCVNVWKGQPRLTPNQNGEYVDAGFKWDTNYIARAGAAFDADAAAIREMGDRWAGGFQPHISQLADYKAKQTEGGETVSVEQQYIDDLADTANAVKIEDSNNAAMEIAERRAEQARQYNEVLQHYRREGNA